MDEQGRKRNTHDLAGEQLKRLLEIMQKLRGPQGCPWDRKQNSATLKPYLIEEAYEVLEAIDSESPEWLCEELGDVLLQIAFHAQIHHEQGHFSMHDVARSIADKMERRHPHVFGSLDCTCEETLRDNWERIKREEKMNTASFRATRRLVPKHLPALLKAQKLSSKFSRVDSAVRAPEPELPDVLQIALDALRQTSRQQLFEILPSLLYAIVDIAESRQIDCETHLSDFIDALLDRAPPEPDTP